MEYEFPPHVKVSKECRDLLHKILVPDPAKRITVHEIQNHVWYKKDLPPGVAEMNDNLPPPGAGLQVFIWHKYPLSTLCVLPVHGSIVAHRHCVKDERQSIDCDVNRSFSAVLMPRQCAKLFLMLPVLQVSVTGEVRL